MTDSWRQETFDQDNGWPVTTVVCTVCTERRSAFPPLLYRLGVWKREHEATCGAPSPPRCLAMMNPGMVPEMRCILNDGHPIGTQYDWCTDYNGHMWERP